ncbi:MAG: SIMPL domain-containing protein, partial [Lachnospiraceae bacterium]|nr:SIMPL domain-containing protein [Lachnospiraceae bacterium]
MERTIRVTGKGNLSVKPDTIRLIMTMEGMKEEYDAALAESANMTEYLKQIFSELGFEKEAVKTLGFNVSAKYESYQAKDKSWKRRFEGYKYVHRMIIEFPADNKQLGKVLYKLGHSTVRPEFRIEYTVAEPEKCKNELLANAVTDAKAKADVLSKAAGVSMGEIITIDYSWAEIDFVSRPMDNMMLEECCMRSCETDEAYDIDINPDDIDVTDNVTI